MGRTGADKAGEPSARAERRPRARDIAELLGVSETAVSFALNGRAGISDETRDRILRTVAEMGYTPNYAARALSGGGASTVGFVVARSPEDVGSEAFFLQLMSGMQAALSASDYGLLFQLVPDVDAEVAVYRRWKAENRVDGVVLVDLREDDPRPAAVAELGLPSVLAGGPDPSGRLVSVAIDDVAAVELVLDHLVDRGHHRLGYVAGEPHLAHVARRIAAIERAAPQRGVTVSIVPTDFSAVAGARAVAELMSRPQAPTALVFDNEVLAISGIDVVRALGRAIPSEVAVVSLEDSLICTATRPQVTALHRETHEFGRVVAEHLLAEIAGHGSPSEQAPLPRLMVRGSTDSAATIDGEPAAG